MIFLRKSQDRNYFSKFLIFCVFFTVSFFTLLGCQKKIISETRPDIHQNTLAASLLNEGVLVLDQNKIDLYYLWNNSKNYQNEEKIPHSERNIFFEAPISDLEILHFFYLYSNSSDDISTLLTKWTEKNPRCTENEKLIDPEVDKTIKLLIKKRDKIVQKEGLLRIRNINILWKEYRNLLHIRAKINPKKERQLRKTDKLITETYVKMSLNGYHPLSEEKLLALPATGKITPVKSFMLYDNGEIESIEPLIPVKLKLKNRKVPVKCTGTLKFYKKGRVKSFYTKDSLFFSLSDRNRLSITGGRISLYPDGTFRSVCNVKPFSLYLPNGDVALADSVTYSINGELLHATFPPNNMPAIRLPDGTVARSIANSYTRLGRPVKIYPYGNISIHLPGGEIATVKGSTDSLENGIEYFPSGVVKKVALKDSTILYIPQFGKQVKLKGEIEFCQTGEVISGELLSQEDVILDKNPTKLYGSFQFYASGNLSSAKLLTYNLKSINPNNYISYSEKNSPVQIILYPNGKLKHILFNKKSAVYIKSGNQTFLKSASYTPLGKTKAIELYSGTVKVSLPADQGKINAARKISFHKNGTLDQTVTIHSFTFPLDIKTKLLIPANSIFASYSNGTPQFFSVNPKETKPFYIKGIPLSSPGNVELYPNGSLKSYSPINPIDIILPGGLSVQTHETVEFHPEGILKKITPSRSIRIDQRNIPYRFSGTLYYHNTGYLEKVVFQTPTKLKLGDDFGAMVKIKSTAHFTPEGILYQFDL